MDDGCMEQRQWRSNKCYLVAVLCLSMEADREASHPLRRVCSTTQAKQWKQSGSVALRAQ